MTSSFILPQECFKLIFVNLEEVKDLYSAMLVDRQWCRNAVGLLWSTPMTTFHNSIFLNVKLIKTYILCLPIERRQLLINQGIINFSQRIEENTTTIFPYETYLKELEYKILYIGIHNWIENGEFKKKNYITKQSNEIQMKIFLITRELSKMFIREAKSLKSIVCNDLNNYNFIKGFNDLFKFDGVQHSLKYLSIINFENGETKKGKLFLDMMNVCKHLEEIKVKAITKEEAISLSKLINRQKNLIKFGLKSNNNILLDNIGLNNYNIYDPIFEALESSKDSLRNLELSKINFTNFSEKALKSFMKCKLIETLGLYIISGVEFIYPCTSIFKNLRTCKFIIGEITKSSMNIELFIINILKVSGNNLNELSYSELLRDYIYRICENITKFNVNLSVLKMGGMYPDEVCIILDKCIDLQYFEFFLLGTYTREDLIHVIEEKVPSALDRLMIVQGSSRYIVRMAKRNI